MNRILERLIELSTEVMNGKFPDMTDEESTTYLEIVMLIGDDDSFDEEDEDDLITYTNEDLGI